MSGGGPEAYRLRPLSAAEQQGWLEWSLAFFTDPSLGQQPYISLTLALEVSQAWRRHRAREESASFFCWLSWSLLQTLADHPCFRMRQLEGAWWVVENPPVVIPVAVGGAQRFVEMVLPDGIGCSWPVYAERYATTLERLRGGQVERASREAFNLGVFLGHLPALPFTALHLHSQAADTPGRCSFYLGQRQWQGERLTMPLAVQLHHATADPFVLNLLLEDWRRRFLDAA